MWVRKATIRHLIHSGETERIVEGLIALSFLDNDWRWIQSLCLFFSKSEDENVRGIAILCLGHLARIHRTIDIDIVKPVILEALNDHSDFVRGHADSALIDLETFCVQSE